MGQVQSKDTSQRSVKPGDISRILNKTPADSNNNSHALVEPWIVIAKVDPATKKLLSEGVPVRKAILVAVGIAPEIWRMVGEQIDTDTKKTLFNLSLTCSYFNAVFTPLLFSHINLTRFTKIVGIRFETEFLNLPQLYHVRSLRIASGTIYNRVGMTPRDEMYDIELFNERLIMCLERMPQLISFSFGELGCEVLQEPYTAFGYCTAPIFRSLLDALRLHSSRLRNLAISMPNIPLPNGGHGPNAAEIAWFWTQYAEKAADHIGIFKNLTSLAVVYRTLHVAEATESLIATLMASPNLDSLSIDCPAFAHMQGGTGLPFLHDVCHGFKASGGKPMYLRYLRLGEALITPDGHQVQSYDQRWDSVASLVEFSEIESLQIHSQCHDWAGVSAPTFDQLPLYQIVTDTNEFCSIRRLSLERLDTVVLALLKNVSKRLTLPKKFLSELFFYWFDYNDRKIRDGLRFNRVKRQYWPEMMSFSRPLKVRNVEASRRLFIETISNFRGLKFLRIPLDMSRQGDAVLAASIPKLFSDNLKELAIHKTAWSAPPRKEDRNFVDRAFINNLAWLLANRSKLRYVRIHETGFRIIRHPAMPGIYFGLQEINLKTSDANESEIFTLYRE